MDTDRKSARPEPDQEAEIMAFLMKRLSDCALWLALGQCFCFHARGCTSSGLQWPGKASTCILNAKERRGMLKTIFLTINGARCHYLTTTGPKERFNKDIKRAARKTNFKPGNTIAQVADQLYLNEAMEEVPARPDIKSPRHGTGAASSS
ncbi:TPA: hypothetical protein ACH3X1_001219 [Trebouxia sp. C0004]